MKVLVLKLESIMLSFGDVAVDEFRPTARHPFKSMVVGILANALGYKRTDWHKIEDLQSEIKIASRIDREGNLMTDYQIALTNPSNPKEPTFIDRKSWTTKDVLNRTDGNDKNAIQIYRDYLTDASITVAISSSNEEILDKCISAVKKPARPLFIGRKACVPTRPIFEAVTDADSLFEVLSTYPTTDGKEEVLIRTEGNESHLYEDTCRELLIRDGKDWINGFHAYERPIVEGIVKVKEIT